MLGKIGEFILLCENKEHFYVYLSKGHSLRFKKWFIVRTVTSMVCGKDVQWKALIRTGTQTSTVNFFFNENK